MQLGAFSISLNREPDPYRPAHLAERVFRQDQKALQVGGLSSFLYFDKKSRSQALVFVLPAARAADGSPDGDAKRDAQANIIESGAKGNTHCDSDAKPLTHACVHKLSSSKTNSLRL